MKKIIINIALYLTLVPIVMGSIYYYMVVFGQETVHFVKMDWNAAEAAEFGIDENKLKRVKEYIDARLPSARGLIVIKNGSTVFEEYFWKGGPRKAGYLHSLNGGIIHVLIGIALEKQLITGLDQPLTDFFPDYPQIIQDGGRQLNVGNLLEVRAPLLSGKGSAAYWRLFYARDKAASSLAALARNNAPEDPVSNFAAFYLLSHIISTASGDSLIGFADKHLFTPLGITTYPDNERYEEETEVFLGFRLTALDLAKFGVLMMNKGRWEGEQVVPRTWIERTVFTGNHELQKGPAHIWRSAMIKGGTGFLLTGESGQYVVLLPEHEMVVAVTSKSGFPLPGNNGYAPIFELIVNAAQSDRDPEASFSYFEPNFVFTTAVPEDIRRFFRDFARDIAAKDLAGITRNYAKGYSRGSYGFKSVPGFWRKMFFGGTGMLESVEINKVRIDGNRAYLRGKIKYSYANMNEGSFGWFPLDNLIKLKGRWHWFGSPEYADILDGDDYFDAETTDDVAQFIQDCSDSFSGAVRIFNDNCFSDDFSYRGADRIDIINMIKPLLKDRKNTGLHVTEVSKSVEGHVIEGYIENSAVGALRLPPGIKIIKKDGRWKWSGNTNPSDADTPTGYRPGLFPAG